jgi:pyridoxamine 5'-phosphate oxidase
MDSENEAEIRPPASDLTCPQACCNSNLNMKKISPSWLHRAAIPLSRPWLWRLQPLHKKDLDCDPFVEFGKWYARACRCWRLEWPEAVCVSTIDNQGFPEGRMVLLKDFDHSGFVFYTNTLSAKGQALAACPKAALTFYWEPLQHQIRIQGEVTPVTAAEADEYFASRIRLSQIGAWASLQTQVCPSREVFENRVREITRKFGGQAVPRPPHWSGYRVVPRLFEFWSLRPARLHDRFRYKQSSDGNWKLDRLYP